jgi:hypothetical protein
MALEKLDELVVIPMSDNRVDNCPSDDDHTHQIEGPKEDKDAAGGAIGASGIGEPQQNVETSERNRNGEARDQRAGDKPSN